MAASLGGELSKLVVTYGIIVLFFVCKICESSKRNSSQKLLHWSSAGATWYGGPNGAGSDGTRSNGNLVSEAPFASMVTGIGPSLYKSGKECVACYMIKCRKHPLCSRKMVITDLFRGGACLSDAAHFDLSGTAFGAMAVPGQQDKLRDAGMLQIRYARGRRPWTGGSKASIELEMKQSWGAVWKLDPGFELHRPLSIRLISQHSLQTLVAKNAIPIGWRAGATYTTSLVNYL
ncbi:hypothetical protein SASPL_148600 [Salvia splendens]|uniref:Expansin-like EG45 domain-containing protein n=1 Tax=Salvia splendens TaxID=180675 RepID=A0A8X8W9D2_SALSN|nr:hypothetical protein SASPL_148600 [Salvia splendens]